MTVVKTNAAIIEGVLVPATEVTVLRALVALGRPATVPELAKAMNEKLSDASLYSLLGRLAEQRGLVTRAEGLIEVHGTEFKRVFWSPSRAAINHFEVAHEAQEEGRRPGRAPA